MCFHHRPQLSWSELQPYHLHIPHSTYRGAFWPWHSQAVLQRLGPSAPSCLLSYLLFWVSAQQSFWERDTFLNHSDWVAPPPCPSLGPNLWVLAPQSESSLSALLGEPLLWPPVDGQSVLWGQGSLPRTSGLKTYLFLNSRVTLATNKLFRFRAGSLKVSLFVLNVSHLFLFSELCVYLLLTLGGLGSILAFQGLSSGRLFSVLSCCGHTGLEHLSTSFWELFAFVFLFVCFSDYIRFILVWTKKGWFDLVPSNSSFHGNSELETSIHWVLFYW